MILGVVSGTPVPAQAHPQTHVSRLINAVRPVFSTKQHIRDGSRLATILEVLDAGDYTAALTELRQLLSAANQLARPRRGPKAARFGQADRNLFPEIERIMRERHVSPTEAALELVHLGKVAGGGTALSRTKRLANRFLTS